MKKKFEKKTLDYDIYGVEYKLNYPTPRQVKDYLNGLREIIDGKSDKTDMDLVLELLDKLGLPRDKSEDMDMIDLQEISNYILNQKKS